MTDNQINLIVRAGLFALFTITAAFYA